MNKKTPGVLALVLLLFTSGCATPTPISMTNDSISIKYDVAINSQDEVRTQAENYCETMKKKALYRATTMEGLGWGIRYDHFNCVKQ